MIEEDHIEISQFWRLAEKLNLIEAALLMIGIEPQGISANIEQWSDDRKPAGYIAAREAIKAAIDTKLIEGQIHIIMRDGFETASINYKLSNVHVSGLINWLDKRGFATDAFKKADATQNKFLDPKHPRYSHKLAAVVEAWESFDPESKEVGTPKQRIMKWLRLNASRFGLTSEDGSPSENVIEELAKVANWSTAGGAPKSKKEEPDPF